MKNVLVAALGSERYAFELRWVREVVTLGPVTRVPTAPLSVAGVVNIRGAVTPVLSLPPLLRSLGLPAPDSLARPRAGGSSVMVQVEDMRAAIAIDRVDSVTSLVESETTDALVDKRGRIVHLLDARAMFQIALAHTSGVASASSAIE